MTQHRFNPELTRARFLPRTIVLGWNLRIVRALTALAARRLPDGVEVVAVDGDVSVRVYRPTLPRSRLPALLWIHGGGMVMGCAAQDDRLCLQLAREAGIVVASVEYRLAPEHPFPTPLDDCYRALRWLAGQPHVDAARIAVGGASAGGGLAAGLALMAKERGEIAVAAQVLSYPMLDDRTTERDDVDRRRLRLWNQRSNRFGWEAYLGRRARSMVPPLAAPSRYGNLAGLPPAWIGVGTSDLFYDEDVEYARRLTHAGVPCELHVVPGAYHGFDLVESRAAISKAFARGRQEFLKAALNGPEPTHP